jgi:hypothetical protein
MEAPNNIERQVMALSKALEKEARRVRRWLIVCFVFAVAISSLAIKSKDFVFLVVALFFWFFAWNRWKLWCFLRAFLPPPSENQEQWMHSAVGGLERSRFWYWVSEYIAVLTLLAAYVLITILNFSTGEKWMRVFIVACWSAAIAVLAWRLRNAFLRRKRNRDRVQ